MNNFFCNHTTHKVDPEHSFSEPDLNYKRDYSKGKSFRVSEWNEIDTYNNDDFIQDFVIYGGNLWVRIDSTPSTNEIPTDGPWKRVMKGLEIEDIVNILREQGSEIYDSELSESSNNAVKNSTVTSALNEKVSGSQLERLIEDYVEKDDLIKINGQTIYNADDLEISATIEQDIQINGGPLDFTGNDWPWIDENANKYIPAGTSLTDIITNLFLKVTPGTVIKEIIWDPKLTKASITMADVGKTLEIGTKITASATDNFSVTDNVRTCVFTCDPGYFLLVGTDETGKFVFGDFVEGNKTVYASAVSPSVTGTSSRKNYWNNVETTSTEHTITIEGNNTFTSKQSGLTAHVGKFDDIVVYGATNTKIPAETVFESISNDVAPNGKPLESINSATVKGARAYWMGSVKNTISFDSLDGAAIRDAGESKTNHMTKGLGTNPPVTVTAKQGDSQVIIATQKQIAKITSENQQGAQIGAFKEKSVAINGANNYTAKNYYVYSWIPANEFDKDDKLTITYK